MLHHPLHLNYARQSYTYAASSSSLGTEGQPYSKRTHGSGPLTSSSASSVAHSPLLATGVAENATIVSAPAASDLGATAVTSRSRVHLRKAAGKVWNDPTLDEWDANDFRVFCGDLGNEVTDELLSNAFRGYKSFQAARVIRDKRTGKGRGYGFVSFRDPHDMLRALKEMDRKYVGNRPIRVMKSQWKGRELGATSNKRVNEAIVTVPNNSKVFKKFKYLEKQKMHSARVLPNTAHTFETDCWNPSKALANSFSEGLKKKKVHS